jgi:hypothetical protein
VEKNRKTLVEALNKLREYQPVDNLWDRIEIALGNDSMNNVLNHLSRIEPPDFIWEKIDNELTIREKSHELNIYQPPDEIWKRIDQSLSDKEKEHTGRNIRKLVRWSLAAAAALVLGLIIVTVINPGDDSLTFSEELLTPGNLKNWQNDDAFVDQTVALICKEKPEVCQSPEFKKLEKELDFLNQSKQAVVKQMNQYDNDISQDLLLTKIELEQSDIIKQMAAFTN